jgi:hypothetical protein
MILPSTRTHASDLSRRPRPATSRHAREITEQEQRFEFERERQARAMIVANAAAEQRIADLEAEVLEVARATGTVCDALEHELARVTRPGRPNMKRRLPNSA